MQNKNIILLKSLVFTIALILAYSFPLLAEEKSAQENEKKNESSTKEVIIFESCEKNGDDKCRKITEIPIPDYSKSLK